MKPNRTAIGAILFVGASLAGLGIGVIKYSLIPGSWGSSNVVERDGEFVAISRGSSGKVTGTISREKYLQIQVCDIAWFFTWVIAMAGFTLMFISMMQQHVWKHHKAPRDT